MSHDLATGKRPMTTANEKVKLIQINAGGKGHHSIAKDQAHLAILLQ